jgi:AcrR family transcriptional regulator
MYHVVHPSMYHMVHAGAQVPKKETSDHNDLIESCLGAFVRSGTLDLSLDQLASGVGISKRMLVHYFGRREAIEERAMTLLENRLRAQFAPENFPAGIAAQTVLNALWDTTTNPESKGVLLLVMDLSRRAWNGSARAKSFYQEQQRLWVELLMRYLPDRNTVEDVLQSFQGAVLAYLITGNPEPGRRMLNRLCTRLEVRRKHGRETKQHRTSRIQR